MRVMDSKKILSEVTGSGASMVFSGYEKTKEIYEDVILSELQRLNLKPSACGGLCAGAVGVDTPNLQSSYIDLFCSLGFPRESVMVCNDCEILLNLYPDEPVIAVAAGTGAIIVGRGDSKDIVRYSGWGHLLSDEGSAFYIVGRAFEDLDGEDNCPELYSLFKKETALSSQQEIVEFYRDHIFLKQKIAQFAPLVEQATKTDKIASSILVEAGEKLAYGVSAVAKKILTENKKAFVLLLWGSVLANCATVGEALREKVKEKHNEARIETPKMAALDCVSIIACKM
jgi:N-acetylglucosamine kinase-like BadF-type ATPase